MSGCPSCVSPASVHDVNTHSPESNSSCSWASCSGLNSGRSLLRPLAAVPPPSAGAGAGVGAASAPPAGDGISSRCEPSRFLRGSESLSSFLGVSCSGFATPLGVCEGLTQTGGQKTTRSDRPATARTPCMHACHAARKAASQVPHLWNLPIHIAPNWLACSCCRGVALLCHFLHARRKQIWMNVRLGFAFPPAARPRVNSPWLPWPRSAPRPAQGSSTQRTRSSCLRHSHHCPPAPFGYQDAQEVSAAMRDPWPRARAATTPHC